MRYRDHIGRFRTLDPRVRFQQLIFKTKSCWFWIGLLDCGGYGSFYDGERNVKAHDFQWLIQRGKIPRGKFVLHSCDIRQCVNPAHLFLGTLRDNARDWSSKLGLCKRGHEYSEENVRLYRGRRFCIPCERIRGQVRRIKWTRERKPT